MTDKPRTITIPACPPGARRAQELLIAGFVIRGSLSLQEAADRVAGLQGTMDSVMKNLVRGHACVKCGREPGEFHTEGCSSFVSIVLLHHVADVAQFVRDHCETSFSLLPTTFREATLSFTAHQTPPYHFDKAAPGSGFKQLNHQACQCIKCGAVILSNSEARVTHYDERCPETVHAPDEA